MPSLIHAVRSPLEQYAQANFRQRARKYKRVANWRRQRCPLPDFPRYGTLLVLQVGCWAKRGGVPSVVWSDGVHIHLDVVSES